MHTGLTIRPALDVKFDCFGSLSLAFRLQLKSCFHLQAATDGSGPDIIIEMLANVNLDRDLQLINKYGTIVVSSS